MLVCVAAVCLALAVVVYGVQILWVLRLARLYPARRPAARGDRAWPRVAVLLPVRGADPSLRACLVGLLTQDYPDYAIRVVVDSPDDPGWQILREVLAQHPGDRVQTELLRDPRATCSLKVSALLQAIAGLDESYGAIVLVDGDVVPEPDWLRALIEPLADPKVGATAGVRWYEPGDARWGTLVRAAWNAAACTQMHAFGIPWAGSMALRADVFRSREFLDTWAVALADDTAATPVLRNLGLQLRTVPAATMMNHETTGLGACYWFIRRQLLSARLYHPAWGLVLTLGLLTGGLFLAGVGLLGAGVVLGDVLTLALAGATLALHTVGLGGALVLLDRKVRRLAGKGRVPLRLKTVPALLVTQALYLPALLGAAWLCRVDWRGVTYEIAGPWSVRLVEYRPYHPPAQEQGRQGSVV